MIIRIKNLRLRTIVGVNPWERERSQEVVVNATIEFDGARAAATDDVNDTIDYSALKRRIMAEVEAAKYFLLERLASRILEIIMADERVQAASVEVDKPHALRFADSVSITCSARRKG